MQKRLFTLYVNRGDKAVNIPNDLVGKLFVIALSPAYLIDKTISEKGISQIKEALSWGCILGQRGETSDKCPFDHSRTDPWHSRFACLYNELNDPEAQLEDLKKGREILTEEFGPPIIFNPINHLYNSFMLQNASKLGFYAVMDRNHFGILSYCSESGIIVIPEAKLPDNLNRRTSAIYADMGSVQTPEVLEVLSQHELILPHELDFGEPSLMVGPNYKMKIIRKETRDFLVKKL